MNRKDVNHRERITMTKFLTGAISAAALMATVSVFGVTAASRSAHADTLPPCSTTVNDHCLQMGGDTMKPSPKVKAAQDNNVKSLKKTAADAGDKISDTANEVGDKTVKAAKDVGNKADEVGTAIGNKADEVGSAISKKADEVGTAIKKKWNEEVNGQPASSPSAIPQGCSPATTPCQ